MKFNNKVLSLSVVAVILNFISASFTFFGCLLFSILSILPFLILIILSAISAISELCVTIMTIFSPFSFSHCFFRNFKISTSVFESTA